MEETNLPIDQKDTPEIEIQKKLLTPEQREEIEKKGAVIVEDRPEILYCATDFMRMFSIAESFSELKPIIFAVSRGGSKPVNEYPEFEEVVGHLSKRTDLMEGILEKNKESNIRTDRGIIDKMENENNTEETKEIIQVIGDITHSNNFSYAKGYLKDKLGQTIEVVLKTPKEISREYDSRLNLELLSVLWLEPKFRSTYAYERNGLDPDKLEILTDLDVLKRILDEDKEGDIQRVIDEYFGGDVEAFQKRWQEFYNNWYPDEFVKMKEEKDKIRKWLGSLIEKK